jgi:hypothetical protein
MDQRQQNYQLALPPAELARLAAKVWTDYKAALGDHRRRMNRWSEYYRRWRALPDQPAIGEEQKSNFPVPLVRWEALAKWAKEMDAIFGEDAEVVAVPVGPSDHRKAKKIGRYMTWRVFNSMKLTRPFMRFCLRKILFGKAHAYAPWVRETFDAQGQEVVDFEGPGFIPLWPDDFIVPAEEVESLHDFSFVIRRYRTTPDKLLQGEEDGIYQGITENFEEIVNLARRGLQREYEGEEVKLEADDAEGILYQRPLSAGESLMVLEWYGKWRMLRPGHDDGDEYDFSRRELRESELVVRYLWDLNKVVGVQDLAELYPGMRRRRPFVESSFIDDGRYWSVGLCELLSDLEEELSANHNLGTEATQLAVNPPLCYRPASGFEPKTFTVEPGIAIPLDNPQTDVKQMDIRVDVGALQWKEQTLLSYKERLTGMSDMAMGRQADRPNAPRTARQTIALLEEGNTRLSLDTKMLAEDMAEVLGHFWQLEYWFAPQEMFFRVTEEDADGLFEVKDGGAILTKEDRDGRYDFRLKFANSIYSREADKERTLARYQIDLQNPLILNNPVALWKVTNEVHAALGDPNFAEIVPQPPAPDQPVDPKEEWTRLLEGEEVHVNPLDNDELHLMRHRRDLHNAEDDPKRNEDAYRKLILHYLEHVEQLQQKKIVQALAEQAVGAIAKLGVTGALPPGSQQAIAAFPGPGLPGGNPAAVFPVQKGAQQT